MENKTKSWFRKPSEEGNAVEEELAVSSTVLESTDQEVGEEETPINLPRNNVLGQKESLDSLELDLLVASETFINRRRLELTRMQDLQHQVQHLQNKISHNDNLLNTVAQKTSEFESIIRNLEQKLTDKQIRYDQLMEDFDTYQVNMREDSEKLRFLLSEQSQKYNQLLEDHNKTKDSTLKLETQYQEEIRSLKAENFELKNRYEEAQKEKKRLMETFNELTSTLTAPFLDNAKETKS